MPILNVKPEERKLIPYRLQAAYELGRVSKKELDEYISKGADAYRIAYESNFQPGMLKKPEPVNDGLGSNDWAVPKEDKILIDDAISVNEEMKTLNSEFESAASEDRRLAYLDALANDPGFFESEFEKAKSTPTLETQKAPGVPDFSDYSFMVQKDKEEADRLNATGELWNRRNKALSRQGGINQKINDAQFKIKGIEDYFAEKGAYGQRLLADVGSNKESLYPLAGGIIGGAIGGPEGATLGSALGSVPMFNLAFNAAYTTARRGGVSDVEARDYAMTMAGSEAFIEAVAGKFGAGSKVARNVFGDTLEKRFGKKVAQAALSEGFEEVLTSTAQEALGAGTLTSDQSSEELKKIVAGNVPMRDDGTIDWGAYAGGKAREFAAGAVAGGALRGVAAPTEIRAENQNQRARETVAKQDIARLKQSLESQGVRGTNLTRLLDQRASQLASQLGLDKGATFTREDIAPTEVNVSEDVTRRTQEMLAGDVKLGKDDAFTLGQMSTMQNVEVGKPTLYKTLQEALQGIPSQPATTLPTLDLSFTVEAPALSQGYRLNLSEAIVSGKAREDARKTYGELEQVAAGRLKEGEGLQLAEQDRKLRNEIDALEKRRGLVSSDPTLNIDQEIAWRSQVREGIRQKSEANRAARRAQETLAKTPKPTPRIETPSFDYSQKVEVPASREAKVSITSTEGLDLGKASSSAREKLLADVQKAASRPELTDKQKKAVEKRGQSMNEFADLAQRELEFEGAFVGKTDDQMAEMIRSRTLAHLQSGKKVEELNTAFNESIKGKPSARKAELNEAEMYLQDSDTTLKRLAKSVDQETIDTLVGRGDVVVKPTFKDLVVDGKVADGNQGFWRSKDGKLYLNAEALGKKNDNAELAYAVLGHELSHGLHAKERKQGEFTNTVKNLLGDSGHASLVTKIKEVAGQNNALGKLATRAVTRATEAKPDAPDLEIAQYFIEELLANDTVPRGQFRKYIDNMVSTARDVVSQFGIKLDIRPKDIEYIIRKELKNQAKNGPVRGVSGKSETLQSVVYTVNSARARAEKDKQFMDPLYNMRAVEVSDKNASLNPNKIVAGTTMNLGEVMNHKELYDYVPRLKNAKLETDPNMKYGEASYDPLSNIVTVSQQSVDSLKSAMARGTGDNAMYRAKTKEIISSIIHETQHGIQSASTPLAKGTSPSNEAMQFEKRANLTKIQREKAGKSGPMTPAQKELLKENAAWWMYMANAGEVQSRAVQAVYAGKYDNYQDALAAISKQFKFLITDAKSQEAFIDWYNENAGTMTDQPGDLLFSRAENTSTKAFKDWFGDSKVVDADGNPLVVYHGTNKTFDKFSNSNIGKKGVSNAGFFFAENPSITNYFAEYDWDRKNNRPKNLTALLGLSENAPQVLAVYLSIKNPYLDTKMPSNDEVKKIKGTGHDGLRIDRDGSIIWVAFRPEQIKSVNNQGTFDPSNPDILMSRAEKADPFYSALTRAVETAQGAPKRATPTQWKQWLDGAQRRGDFKQAERDWIGVDAWLNGREITTRDELAEFVRANQVQVQDVMLGEPVFSDDGYETKFDQYQLPGGQNYRELLLTLPGASEHPGLTRFWELDAIDNQTREQADEYNRLGREIYPNGLPRPQEDVANREHNGFRSSHFPQPNILAHVRFNERTDADGKRVLFVEEVQSDWHQQGRKQGYTSGALTEAESLRRQKDIFDRFDAGTITREQRNEELSRLSDDRQGLRGVPDAPLKKEWPLTAMKRMIRWAADNGFDRVAWTTGEQQAERYDLSKQIEFLDYRKNTDGTYELQADARNRQGAGNLEIGTNIPESDLEKHVGKEVAQKIIDGVGEHAGGQKGTRFAWKRLEGGNLKIGGEGMRAFYDKMLPNELAKYVKKWGGKVGQTKLASEQYPKFIRTLEGQSVNKGSTATVHALDITPSMREAVLEGQPLFSRADDLKQIISDTFKSVTTGIAPKDMRIIMETADNSVKLHEAKMVGASHNLVQAAKKNNVPWADVEDGWQRMIKNKTLDANTGSQPVDEALARMRVAIDDLSRGLIAAYDSSGVPMSTKLKNTIANNINQYISRSFDINADRNYGKKLLEAAKSNPEKKQLLQDLHDFLGKQASELRNVPSLTDKRVKEIHNRLFGTGGKIDKQRADLTKFAGTRKQEEITDALVNDVLRIGNQTKIAGYYSGLSKNEGILKRRDVIPEIIRKVWGERTGVIEAAMTTVVRQGRLLAETEMQANLLRLMPDRFSTSATNTLTEQLEENVSKYGPMSGMYTDPEMAKVIKSRADTAEKIDSDLFDVHDAKINFAALGKKLRNADRTYRKVIGLYKMTTVLGELSNYLYNVLGAAQAATMRSLGGDLAFLNEDGTKTPLKDWSPQFVKDVWSGKVDDKSTPIYQAMIKHGNLQTSLLGDIQDAFDDAARQRGGFKDKKDKFVHVINSAFSSPEATSSALSFANEMNFLKSFWDAEGKKYTYEDLVMAAADRSKTGTISRDRALRAARLADMYGATTYATFFSETFRAPIANIWQAINTVKEAKTPESKKLAQAYATKQIAGASIMLASGLAIHGAAAMLVKALGGHAFGDEPDEIEEALPEGMRSSADNLLVIGEQPGGAKITYDPSMLNTYSALYDPLASALSGKFEQAGDQILQLAFINPLIRKAIGVANGEGKEVSNETTGFLNEVMADAGLSDLVTPGVVNKGASLVSGLEPSWMAPMVQLGYAKATGKSDEAVKDFGGGLAASAFALGARPFRYAPRKALPGAVAGFQENIKDVQNTLNKVVRDKNNGEDTIRKAAQRFYQAEREALVELRPYVVAAMANGMSEKELKQMIGKGFRKNLRESLMDGNWHPTQMTESWLELSYLSNQQNLSDKEREELLNGYRRNRQVFFEEYKNIFSGGNKQ